MLGYEHEAFWDQTIRTLSLSFEAKSDAIRKEHDDRAWLAWHIEALHRAKRLPKLKTLLSRMGRSRQTWQQQMAIMGRWASVMSKIEHTKGKK